MKVEGVDYSAPSSFTFKQRILLKLLPPLIYLFYRAMSATWRWEIRNEEAFTRLIEREGIALFGVWHETAVIFIKVFAHRKVHSTASYSFDGEIIARVLGMFGIGMVRGSSSRGGGLALDNLLKAAPHISSIGITLDGPRGPRHIAKPGLVVMSARLQKPMLACACAAHPAWRMKSWDRMAFPKPFGKIVAAFSEEIPPPPTDSPEDVEHARLQLEQTLNRLHDDLERSSA